MATTQDMKRNTGSCLLLAFLTIGLLWYLGISYLDWQPDRERAIQLKTPEPNPLTALWTEPHGHVGQTVSDVVTVPSMVSDRLFWVRPPGFPAGLLAYSPEPVAVNQDDTVRLEGTLTRPSNIIALEELTAAERQALVGQEALVRVESVTPTSATANLRPLEIEEFISRPEVYAGRYVSGTARVTQVLSQGDLWVLETGNDSIYALLNQDEAEPLASADRLLGANVRVRGHVYSATAGEKARDFEPLAPGDPQISEQPAYLFVDDYEIVEG